MRCTRTCSPLLRRQVEAPLADSVFSPEADASPWARAALNVVGLLGFSLYRSWLPSCHFWNLDRRLRNQHLPGETTADPPSAQPRYEIFKLLARRRRPATAPTGLASHPQPRRTVGGIARMPYESCLGSAVARRPPSSRAGALRCTSSLAMGVPWDSGAG